MESGNIKSFVADYDGLSAELKTACGIGFPYNPAYPNGNMQIEQFHALWDTGAMGSVITRNAAKKLGLSPIGIASVYHAYGAIDVHVYLVSMRLPCNIEFPYVRVTEGELSGVDVLIGMDIIARGDFAITSPEGNTKFTFQIPSTHNIDFVSEYK